MKKIKNVFLLGFLICLSVVIYRGLDLALISNLMVTENMVGMKSSVEDNMPESDFFKSVFFREAIVKGYIQDLQYSVADEESYSDKERLYDENLGHEITYRDYVSNGKDDSIKNLEKLSDVKYIAVNNKTGEVFTNTDYKDISEFKKDGDKLYQDKKGYYQIEYNRFKLPNLKVNNSNYNNIRNFDEYTTIIRNYQYRVLDIMDDISIYIAISENILNQSDFNSMYLDYENGVGKYSSFIEDVIPLSIIGAILFVIYVILNYKLPKTKREFWNYYNKIPLELIIACIVMCYVATAVLLLDTVNYGSLCVIPIFIVLFYLALLLKQFENFERKRDFLETSLIFKILRYLFKGLKEAILDLRKLAFKEEKPNLVLDITILGIVFCLIEAVGVYFILKEYIYVEVIMGVLAVVYFIQILFLMKLVKGFSYLDEISNGVNEIKNGNLNYQIPEKSDFYFATLAKNINNIGQGLEKSIEEQVKSERMKSELITNVSHDLKTPLTSIINYVQLIKREENLQPEYLIDYVNVLDQKSKRLKVLIEDLFEASKASTGNIDLELVKLDLKQLVAQTIGEVQDKLEEADLSIRLNMTNEQAFVLGDGKRLYRVVENLLSNICKYSLKNSRVYIDLSKQDKKVILSMKNISAYELDFSAEEITERFKRGDESRNTEGSGLGLSIAKDLVNLHGGELNIELEADLFKVKVVLNEFEEDK